MNKSDAQAVYTQYWEHARHIENELLGFSAFYATIVAGCLVFFDSLSTTGRPWLIALVLILSIFGFLFNHNLRIPFIKFTLKAELLAIKEFKLGHEYCRFFDENFELVCDKAIDTYDIYAMLFAASITLSLYLLIQSPIAFLLAVPLYAFHSSNRQILDELRKAIQCNLAPPVGS